MATVYSILIILILFISTHCEKRLLLTEDPIALKHELDALKKSVLAQNSELATLMSQTAAQNAELMTLKSKTADQDSELVTLRSQTASQTFELATLKSQTAAQNVELVTLKSQMATFQKDLTQDKGTTYVRWGRKECPNNGTELVYSGITGGSWYDHTGGASEFLCMPNDPSWLKYTDGLNNGGGFVYGAEYESNFYGPNIFDQDAPCAVCLQPKASVTLMIPGRSTCYGGWNLEYVGYLATQYYNWKGSKEYICLDQHPDVLMHGGSNDNGAILKMVEGVCGSLPCPPYVNGRELACVVCSK